MSTTPQPAIGKVRVGDPPPPPAGKEGVVVRVDIFFDGTKNNRSNTAKRLRDRRILGVDGHDGGSSYGNFYSNPAIHEFMNNRNNPLKHEVSHYVEGIGTRNYVEGATHKVKKRVRIYEKNGRVFDKDTVVTDDIEVDELVQDKDNGQDDMYGNAFGAGPTGIPKKVDSGIEQLRIKIKKARGKVEDFFIKKIVFDVFGFSRGAAAGRHFIHRREELLRGPGNKPWPGQRPPELEINFVGLYDSVSSFAKGYDGPGSTLVSAKYSLNTDYIFCNDVGELGLNMGGTPKRVVHLTAADEHRQNFSLTNITTSLTAGVGLELTLPGVHSDIGGSYVEAGAGGGLNTEARCIRSEAEKRRLTGEGWYT
ncbi:MAG: DUF2235 domain-containing protein, partial [Hymenobacter sp.]|nr:DUF2235 domain-containing protein [Hymenobacter sp.]